MAIDLNKATDGEPRRHVETGTLSDQIKTDGVSIRPPLNIDEQEVWGSA
ncbi:MAG TPA: hypothetical protein VKQ09_03705 [Sphingomonas sp.]|nr:hypothetical protein [Sphingomonas sp.]